MAAAAAPNVDQALAAYDQNVANYREQCSLGFQQVEDNLAALRILEHEAQVQENAVVAAQKYLELAQHPVQRGRHKLPE